MYDLSRTCDEIRPHYHHVESCQETVPEAITAFLEGTDFEDVIRTAVSLGGDCDTLTCIAGSIAEAFYGIPKEMIAECRKRLPEEILAMVDRFDTMRIKKETGFHDSFLDGNEVIEEAINTFCAESMLKFYRSCMALAEDNEIKSIAFCCISTGVFGFPQERAAEIAVQTVREHMAKTQSNIEVVFNVFKDEDYKIYRSLLG